MRLYLDTNMLAFMMMPNIKDYMSADVYAALSDYSNTLYTSSVCVLELINIAQIGRLSLMAGKHKEITPQDAVRWLENSGIAIVQCTMKHFAQYADLPMRDDHRDPNDRLIIAQAIADRATLVSSDRKFSWYTRHGLLFLFNDR